MHFALLCYHFSSTPSLIFFLYTEPSEDEKRKRAEFRTPTEAKYAEVIGGVHLVFLTILAVLVIITDIPTLYAQIRDMMVDNIRTRLGGQSKRKRKKKRKKQQKKSN